VDTDSISSPRAATSVATTIVRLLDFFNDSTAFNRAFCDEREDVVLVLAIEKQARSTVRKESSEIVHVAPIDISQLLAFLAGWFGKALSSSLQMTSNN